jgi:hypothetical protein
VKEGYRFLAGKRRGRLAEERIGRRGWRSDFPREKELKGEKAGIGQLL